MSLHDVELYLVDSIDDVMKMKRWLSEDRGRDCLGLDTETSGFDAYAPGAKLRTIQIGDMRTGWIIPFELWGGAALECLNAWEGDISLHNSPFDAHWLAEHAGYNLPWHRVHDTEIMAHIANPNKPAKLKIVSTLHVDPRANAGEVALKKAFKEGNYDFATIPIHHPAYWQYGALDPVLTAHLKDFYRIDEKYPEVYQLEMAVQRICFEMSRRGMRVDLDYSDAKLRELTEKVETGKQWAMDNWGISVTSSDQLVEFYLSIGAKFEKYTDGGKPSVAKDQLEIFMRSDNELIANTAKFVKKIKNMEKMASSYFENFLKFSNDGIVHPNIRTMGARTGRMSVTDPALQTIPRGDALVRDAFIPRSSNELLLSCDYSQVEMRLLAHFSQDEKLRNAFREADATGGDFFVTLGRDIYDDPSFSKKDGRRGLVKSTMYGAAYGSGVQKMADTAGVLFEQMKEVSDGVFNTYPGIKQFMKEIEAVGSQRERIEGEGYVLTGMGRRLPADQGKVYTLTNYILQGTAAELMKRSIVRLDAAGYSQAMCMPIHDEMIFSLPKEDIETASHDIEQLMSYVDGQFSVALPAEPEPGMSRWGDKYRKEGEVFGYNTEEILDG